MVPGETGYPMVDAGMRQLNDTGFMHNRVRMITAAFPLQASSYRLAVGRSLLCAESFSIMNSPQIMATGNGQQAPAAMPFHISGFLILILNRKNLTLTGNTSERWVPEDMEMYLSQTDC